MDDLKKLPDFANSDPAALEILQSQLERLEGQIKANGMTEAVLRAIGSLSKVLSAPSYTDMCHRGDDAPAPQWETTLDDVAYITCAHNPPHIRLK